jgi:hypothetical protein
VLSEIETLARRLEQQITSFEKLHTDELARFQEQLAAYQRLQNDELEMLRAELNRLKEEIAGLKAQEPPAEVVAHPALPVSTHAPTEPTEAYATLTLTRRDLLTGNLLPKRG